MKLLSTTALAVSLLALSACGGGGGEANNSAGNAGTELYNVEADSLNMGGGLDAGGELGNEAGLGLDNGTTGGNTTDLNALGGTDTGGNVADAGNTATNAQ